MSDYIDNDAVILETRIPAWSKVKGLQYGAHVSMTGWEGYYVRPKSAKQWGVARATPANDELVGGDRKIVEAIKAELEN